MPTDIELTDMTPICPKVVVKVSEMISPATPIVNNTPLLHKNPLMQGVVDRSLDEDEDGLVQVSIVA